MAELNADMMQRLRRFGELSDLRKRAKDDESAYADDLARLEEDLLDEMADLGLSKLTVGAHTIYLKPRVVPKRADGVTAEEVGRALADDPTYGEFVQDYYINSQKLAAIARECERLDSAGNPTGHFDLPPALVGLIEPHRVWRLGATPSGANALMPTTNTEDKDT